MPKNKTGVKFFIGVLVAFLSIIVTGNAFSANSSNAVASRVHNNLDGSQTLLGSIPQEVSTSTKISHALQGQALDLRVILPLRNQAELNTLIKDIYDPNSPNYQHYLTPTQFTQQFSPSSIDIASVKEFLKAQGLSVTSLSPNGFVLHVTGQVSAVENAFALHINNYQKSDGTNFYAPDANPTIPVQVAGKIADIAGLDNLKKFTPYFHKFIPKIVNTYAVTPKIGTGPGCGSGGCLAPSDVKTAYNLNAIPAINNPSTLQNVALFELDGYLTSDINGYESYFKIPINNAQLENIIVDGFNGNPSYDGSNGWIEVTIDIEQLLGMAYGSMNTIYVYEADNSESGWVDEWTKIANDDKASVISCSWGNWEFPLTFFDNQIFQQMAAQGQEVFAASGDNGAYSGQGLAPVEPAAQPFLTGVGISTLSINATNGTYQSETASEFGGGGISNYNLIPSYQYGMAVKANTASLVSTTMRNVPDVVLTADQSTPYSFYVTDDPTVGGQWEGLWGSSIAAPTWAAFLTQVNQGRVAAGKPIIGFINPVLYSIAQSSSYSKDFHDITTGDNSYYTGQVGLDLATGLGSFNGLYLYEDLVSFSATVTVPPVPDGLMASPRNNSVVVSWGVSAGATSYNIKRSSGNGGPYTTIKSIQSSSSAGTTYTDTSVTNGSNYYYVISAVNLKGESSNSSQVVVTPGPQVIPAPTGLRQFYWNGLLDLTWDPIPGALWYNLKRSNTSGGPYTTLSSVEISYSGELTGDPSVIPGNTYYYVVTGVTNLGESPNSSELKIVCPITPTGLTAQLLNNQVVLTWQGFAVDTTYEIIRYVNGVPNPANNGQPNPIYVNSTQYIDTSIGYGNTYAYYVNGFNSSGYSALSPPASVTYINPISNIITTSAGPNGSISPSGPVTVPFRSNQSFLITPNSGYNIFSVTDNGTDVTKLLSGNTYTLNNVTRPHTIVANFSLPFSPDGTILNAPVTGLSSPVSSLVTRAGIWTFSSNSHGGGNYVLLNGSTQGSDNFIGDQLLVYNNGQLYLYLSDFGWLLWNGATNGNDPWTGPIPDPWTKAQEIITASAGFGGTITPAGTLLVNQGSNQTFSIVPNYGYGLSQVLVDGTAIIPPPSSYTFSNISSTHSIAVSFSGPPAPPTLSVSSNITTTRINLGWTSSAGATSYLVKRGTASGIYTTTFTTVSSNYSDSSVNNGTTYYYAVEAVNGQGTSARSNEVQLMSLASPALTAQASSGQVVLTWPAVPGAASYSVSRGTASGNEIQIVDTQTAAFTDTTVTNGTTYYYIVISEFSGVTSGNSNEVSVTPSSLSSNGATLNAGSGGYLVTSAGVWTFGTAEGGGNYYILLNGSNASAAGGYASMLLVSNGLLYAYNGYGNSWWVWNGSGWNGTSAPIGAASLTADGTTLCVNPSQCPAPAVSSLVTSAGTWTFGTANGSDHFILLKGISTGGWASILLVYNKGQVYAYNSVGSWYLYNGSAWTGSADPRWSSVAGVTLNGNIMTKSAPTGWGNAGAIGTQQIAGNGSVQFQSSSVPGNSNSVVMAGFIKLGPFFNNSYTGFNYSIVLKYDHIEIYEGASDVFNLPGNCNASDTFSVVRTGSTITYLKNNQLIYTSNTPVSGTLVAAAAFYDAGGTITNAVVAGS